MAAKKSKKAETNSEENTVTIDRRRITERRNGDAEAADTGADTRRKKQRRRHIDPTTCERDYSNQEIEFMRAMDDYKRDSGRMFPTCSEVLEVIRKLGYYKLSESQVEDLGFYDVIEDSDSVDIEDFDHDEELAEV